MTTMVSEVATKFAIHSFAINISIINEPFQCQARPSKGSLDIEGVILLI